MKHAEAGPPRPSGRWRSLRLIVAGQPVLCALQLLLGTASAAEERDWDYRPYRIQAVIAIDVPGGVAEELAGNLPEYLQRRAAAAVGRLWALDVSLASGTPRQRLLAESEPSSPELLTELPSDRDKLVLLAVRWRPAGYELVAREYDRYVQRWGAPLHRECRQEQALSEQVFALVSQAVSPLARFELDPEDENHVTLQPRGSSLQRPDRGEPWTLPGDVFLPVLRRTDRAGQVVEAGIQAVPWTYIKITEHEESRTAGRVQSGTRRPLGVRRQGRVEQVAIALRGDPAPTVVRLHSRTTPDKPLVGYDVYAQDPHAEGSDGVTLLGSTNLSGELSVPPATLESTAGDVASRIRLLYLKNGGQVLARLPIVPGFEPRLDVPLPDDDPRLAAETRLASLREDLIDVVARRNILMARARQKIKQGDLAAAQQFINAINELPGRSQFNLTLTTAARLVRSDDPQIQRRIDQLFEATQTVLSQYLDNAALAELHEELRAAQRKGT